MSDIPAATPRPIPGFTITPDTLAAMDTLHRLVAKELIRRGRWHLVEGRTSPATTDHTPRPVRT
ncbi:hypothetical protein [Methanofollis sp. UBA420]|mgnify:CR=1 FL=1|jgi:hypothetical protein|uniref:hypothetical protein n=1 Tax=Methanofollis sp. UBA420 TaxID=1915514 RepID=UPI00316ABDD2